MLRKMQRKQFAFVIALITILLGNANGYTTKLQQQQQLQEQIQTTTEPTTIIATSTNEAETLTTANANANAAKQITQKFQELPTTTATTAETTTNPNNDDEAHAAATDDVDKASKHFETPSKYEDDIAATTTPATPTPTPTDDTADVAITTANTQLSSVERATAKAEIASINTEVDIAGTTVAAAAATAMLTENQMHNGNGAAENIEIYERRDEVATEAAAQTNNKMAQNVATYRGIQLAEIVNDSDREAAHDTSLQQEQQETDGQQQQQQMATVEEQHYEVQETMPNKLETDNKPTSKLNIVDLYATNNAAPDNRDAAINSDADDGFKHIIKDSNEKLIKERNVFKQRNDAEEHRQNLVPNDVEMQANARAKSSGHMKSVNRAASDDNVSDFTGKLLADQDDIITEIEQKFQLNVPLAAATSTIATEHVEANSAKPLTTPAVTTTTQKPKRKIPVIAGHEFIERRVKKSFGFPMHHAFSASDVMSVPHVDFANTKFTENAFGSSNAMPATNNAGGELSSVGYMDRVSAAPAAPIGLTATHPEFSTTKFYNSKELYNELLQKKLHAGNTMFTASATATNRNTSNTGNIPKTTTATTTAPKPRSGTSRAAIKPTVAAGSILSLKKLQELAETATKATTTATTTTSSSTTTRAARPAMIKLATTTATTTTKTTKAATSKENSAIKRVTLAATMPTDTLTTTTMKPQATHVSTSAQPPSSSPASTKMLAQSTQTTEKEANKLDYLRAQMRSKMRLKAFHDKLNNKNNVETNKTTATATVDSSADKSDSHLTTSTSGAPTEVTFFAYANSATTNTLTAKQQQQQQQPQLQQPPIAVAKPSQVSAMKTIARPRILSRLQEKINALECELLNVPLDSHLWRGNETHELLLPIMTPTNCNSEERCPPEAISWEGEAEIQSGDILIVEINDALLDLYDKHNASIAHTTQVYQVTRPGHEHCDVTEGILLDITPLVVDGRKLVTLYDKDLTEGVNLLIVVSELWGKQCVRLKVTTKTDNCGENADCSGKGVCYSNQAMEEYECQCCSGFAGPHCEEIDACTPSPCTNNGICVDLSQGHEGNSYQCLCPYGYTGKNCQYESDPCNAADCMNGGTCIGNSTHFRCDCTAGYTGPLCQHSLNECESSPCVHGICVDQEDGFRCFCQPGFAGELCNFEYNECESNPCQNSGECIDHIGSYECHCTKGYTGNRCHIKVDFCANKPCPEGHRCLDHGNDFSCECSAGLNGIDCGNMPRMQCNVNPCTHGGTCWSSGDSFYCACRPGFTGTMCEDEFVVETVVSSSEFMVDDTSARNFNDKTFGSSVVLKSPIELHNAYFAAGVLAAALFIVAIVVTICHCKVNQTYRKFSTRSTTFFPIIGFGRRPKMQNKLNKHWLSGKGFGSVPSTGGAGSSATGSTALRTNTTTQRSQQHTNTSGSIGGQLHERPFQRHLAMNLENDMYYTVDFSENSQHSPLIQ